MSPDASPPADPLDGLRRAARNLEERYLGKAETIRLLLVAILSGEHAVIVGPPGTAKSALVRDLSSMLGLDYFEYLLTRFTEPNEIFGPVDIEAFRRGEYRRRTEGMLPEAQIVFLDEVFKSNSAILNALLSLLNERRFRSGATVVACPVVTVFGASNEVPGDDSLAALFDRFLLRIRSRELEAHHFDDLLRVGASAEVGRLGERGGPLQVAWDLRAAREALATRLQVSEPFAFAYRSLVFQIRAEGIPLSDRRVVKLLKAFAASALLDGRDAPDEGDLHLLRHVWGTEDQAPLLDALVGPVLEAFAREHPERQRVGAVGVGVPALAAEIDRIRAVLTADPPPGDAQLFGQLRALAEVRAALAGVPADEARALERRIDALLDATLSSGRYL